MTYPFHNRLLKDSPAPADGDVMSLLKLISCGFDEGSRECERAVSQLKTAPTESDLQQFVRMYS
jgi:hypothetical protein